jgi:hypothetical protein
MSDNNPIFPEQPSVSKEVFGFAEVIHKTVEEISGAYFMGVDLAAPGGDRTAYTLATAGPEGSLTFEDVTAVMEEMERLFPRKTTAVAFRMCEGTYLFLKGSGFFLRPASSNIVPVYYGSHLNGMPVKLDDEVPRGDVQVLNRDDEIIKTIPLWPSSEVQDLKS